MTRLERLRDYMRDEQLQAVVLSASHHIAAVFSGARAHNGVRPEPPGRIGLVVRSDRVFVLGNGTEVARMVGEELTDFEVTPVAFPWQSWNLSRCFASWWPGGKFQADCFGEGKAELVSFLDSISYPLDSEESQAIAALGHDVATILVRSAQALEPGQSEQQIAAQMSAALLECGADPDLVFVVFDERIARFRHCRPGAQRLVATALLSITASRRGLFVSATRLVSVKAADVELDAEQLAANHIDAAGVAFVRERLSEAGEGASVAAADVYAVMARAYERQGRGAGVDDHHIGGPSGFRGRDSKLSADSHEEIGWGRPFAFNPVFGSGKSEDTWIMCPQRRCLVCLTETKPWPMTTIDAAGFKLERPGIARPRAVLEGVGAAGQVREVGIIGLGRMGLGAARRLATAGLRVVGHDPGLEQVDGRIELVASVSQLVARLSPPRMILLWVPADVVDDCLWRADGLAESCAAGDVIVDGGNSHYADALRRHEALSAKGLAFVDVATSGGTAGAEQGYCMAVGCRDEDYARFAGVAQYLAAPGACTHVGPAGSASFVKTVHNGIEYGMLAAMAEGMALLERAPEATTLRPSSLTAFRSASIIESRIMDWFCQAADGDYRALQPYVGGGETGRWCLESGLAAGVSMPVLSAALAARFASQGGDETASRLLAEVRRLFGGHAVRRGPADDEQTS